MLFHLTAKFLTQPMSDSWKGRLQETQGDVFGRSPEARKLRDKLLSIGGGEVLLHHVSPSDINRLLERGQLWSGWKSRMLRMQHNRCHENSVRLWEGKKGDLANGFALSKDGLWREHTWIVNGDVALETTARRVAYYGARLTEEEIRREYDPDFFCHQVYGSLKRFAGVFQFKAAFLKSAAVIWSNGWITPKGRWKALEDGETHAIALPERLRVLWNEWAGGDNQAIKEGWIRVIMEEPYWSSDKTGKMMADFNFQTYDTNTRQRLRRAILNLDPEIEMVGLDCEEVPGFETLTVEDALKRVG